jgi:hypothetical protein
LLSLEPTAADFRMSGKCPGSEKIVHGSTREKVMGTSDHHRGVGTAGSMFRTSRRWLLAFLTSLLNSQRHQKACWYTIQSQIDPQAHEYLCSFHSGVFHGIDILGEREV